MMRAAFLPESAVRLAADEAVLWQGRPGARALARRLFRVRAVGFYLAVLVACNTAAAVAGHHALAACGWLTLAAAGVCAFLEAAAYCLSRTTLYVITDRRIILHIGIALPIALTLPLRKLAAADLRLYADGSGDLPVTLDGGKLAYLLLWPHVRPWRFRAPQPMLRAVPAARDVAAVLARACRVTHPEAAFASQIAPPATARPRGWENRELYVS